MFICDCFIGNNNYVKMVYSESCIFLATRKDVNFDFLKDKISFENMCIVRCVRF